METIAYLPHYSGWEMSPEVLGQPFNFGYFRAQGDLLLYGLVGASVALEADLGIMLTGDKQGVKGTPKGQKSAKAKAGAKGGIELFAGIKEGVQLSGAVQWLNPEGVLGTGKPKKLKANQAIAEFADIAKVSLGGEAIEGLAAKLGFECAFRNGSFRIAADANLCLGLGGGGKVAADVGAATIGDFCMCVCHMLKQADCDSSSTPSSARQPISAQTGRACSGCVARDTSARRCRCSDTSGSCFGITPFVWLFPGWPCHPVGASA